MPRNKGILNGLKAGGTLLVHHSKDESDASAESFNILSVNPLGDSGFVEAILLSPDGEPFVLTTKQTQC